MAELLGKRVSGKRALVTGAGSGIGRATSILFAREGARVSLVDRNVESLTVVQQEMRQVGGVEGLPLVTDVTVEEDVANAVESAVAEWGGLDVLVVSAGVQLFGRDARVDELELEAWNDTLAVNLTGAFLACKHATKAMLSTGGGSVVLVGSPTGLYGLAPGFTAYSASKAGVFALARVMASGYAQHGIRVNVVLPGFTDTPLVVSIMNDDVARDDLVSGIPLRRPGTAAEVASLILFLASDESGYVTGGSFCVDGGITAV